ncbi:MAG TPA: hypothetical protein VND94_00690 [Terriglobia bacterium]|nr:hypothetical protein [Terriglobia bacterium]
MGPLKMMGASDMSGSVSWDAIVQSLATLAAAGLAGWVVAWQVRKSFENERRQRQADRRREIRDELLPLRAKLREVEELSTLLAAEYESADHKTGKGFAFLHTTLPAFASLDLSEHMASLTRSEQLQFQNMFNNLRYYHSALSGPHAIDVADRIVALRHLAGIAEDMQKRFDEHFPPE